MIKKKNTVKMLINKLIKLIVLRTENDLTNNKKTYI